MRFILVLLLAFCMPARADSGYVSLGIFHNPDAAGTVSGAEAAAALGYEKTISDSIALQIEARHVSDALRRGEEDKISHKSYGANLVVRF